MVTTNISNLNITIYILYIYILYIYIYIYTYIHIQHPLSLNTANLDFLLVLDWCCAYVKRISISQTHFVGPFESDLAGIDCVYV